MYPGENSAKPSRRDVLRCGIGAVISGIMPTAAIASKKVQTRVIPSSGEALPIIGLGTYDVFDVGDSAGDRNSRREVLAELLEGGASLVDSSPMYRRAEAVSGDLAADLRLTDQVFWATKVWADGADQGRDQMEQSLRYFRTDQIDLMQVHNLRDWQVHMTTLRDWKERGRVRYIGVTHYRVEAFEELEKVIRSTDLDFVQLNYSIAEPEAENRLLPLCADRGIATLINRPFQRGALFSRVKNTQPPDWASEFSAVTWGQFFLKFILGHPAVTCVIPATGKAEHMVDNLAAGVGPLPDSTHRKVMVNYLSTL
jgi:diketogulonate reductase-like aldo/keto reductase